MVNNFKVKIDLKADLFKEVKTYLESKGFEIGKNLNDKITIAYYNYLLRSVPPRPRNVFKPKNFLCPPKYKKRVQHIEKAIRKGKDINKYLSRRLNDLDYNDMLLNDWGIHHIHLGKNSENDGYIERTGNLLFVKFTEQGAYFLKVMGHKNWTNKDLIKIIHDNWPDVIKRYRVPDALRLNEEVTERAHQKLRNGGSLTFTQIEEGVVYAPMNGYATSGDSIDAVMKSNTLLNNLSRIQMEILEANDIHKKLRTQGNILEFSLLIKNGNFLLKEKISGHIEVLFYNSEFKDF